MNQDKSHSERRSILTPATWLNSAHVESWLREVWGGWRWDDIRHDWDESGNWFWIAPDFERGRSRVVGVTVGLLEDVTVAQIKRALEDAHWLQRIDQEPLLIARDDQNHLEVGTWNPVLDEAWFDDPRGGYFVAYPSRSGSVTTGAPPARLPEHFLALHGKDWSALGPRNPKPAKTYVAGELQEFIPT
jgi:hypothetical protein